MVWCIVRRRAPARTAERPAWPSATAPARGPGTDGLDPRSLARTYVSRRASTARSCPRWWRKMVVDDPQMVAGRAWRGSSSTSPRRVVGGRHRWAARGRASAASRESPQSRDTHASVAVTGFHEVGLRPPSHRSKQCAGRPEAAMEDCVEASIASTTSVLLATAAASSGFGPSRPSPPPGTPGRLGPRCTQSHPQAKSFVKGAASRRSPSTRSRCSRSRRFDNDPARCSRVATRSRSTTSCRRCAPPVPTEVDQFNFPFWAETQPPVLNMVAPTPTYVPATPRTATCPAPTSSPWPTRRPWRSPTLPCSRRRHRRPAHGRLDQRLRSG